MAGRNVDATIDLSVVWATGQWGVAGERWKARWQREWPEAELIVVDTGDLGTTQLGPGVQVLQAHRGFTSMALNVGLNAATGARVIFQETPRAPPPGFAAAFRKLPVRADTTIIGPGAPPDGEVQTALDVLMLHLISPDALQHAPNRWANVPGTFWACFPTARLRAEGGLEAAEACFELAIQDACLRLGRLRSPHLAQGLPWSVNRITPNELAEGVRGLTAARIRRLGRHPDSRLEPGWSLATVPALESALARDAQGEDREKIILDTGAVDVRPMARAREWAPVARDLLRRLLVALKQQQQRWLLEGLLEGLVSCEADGIPDLLARHPLRIGGGQTVVLPVEREDGAGLIHAITNYFRCTIGAPSTLAVVAGPTTSSRLRRSLGREWHSLELMAALAGAELVMHPTSLTAARAIRILANASGWVPVERLQGEAWSLHAKALGTPSLRPESRPPWPLDIARPVRLLAWPDWNNPSALAAFVDEVILPLAGRSEVALCLRFDPQLDGDLRAAQQRLDEEVSGKLTEDANLEVLILNEPMPGDIPARLGLSVHAWVGPLRVPEFVASVGAPVSSHPHEVLAVWDSLSGDTPFDGPSAY